jgi:deazaflavin-dependent oxidoreductase (nitroreductase family)
MSEGESFNEQVIEDFRAHGGIVASFPIPGVTIALVHHVGRRTGAQRIAPVICQPLHHGWAIFAANGGAVTHPAWYHNLVARPRTVVEVGDIVVEVATREASGAERRRIWEEQKRRTPFAADYETTASPREIPVIVLEPDGEDTPASEV